MRIRQNRFRDGTRDFYRWFYGEIECRGIEKREIAKVLGITPSCLSKKLRDWRLTFEEVMKCFEYLGATDQEIISIVRRY